MIINIKQWIRLKEATYVTVLTLLGSVEILVEYANNPIDVTKSPSYVAVGLYTYAIEEFGKLTYLKQLMPKDEKVEIDFDEIFRKHPSKFKLAINTLPKECIVVQRGDPETITDWETRLNILYTGIDEKGNVEYRPLINLADLSHAVPIFRDFIRDFGYE